MRNDLLANGDEIEQDEEESNEDEGEMDLWNYWDYNEQKYD